jgi:phosphatidylserine/phosphatidylglycerophosphate/cardiolipin synthase-like enzyme
MTLAASSRRLAEGAARLAADLPTEIAEVTAGALLAATSFEDGYRLVAERVGHPQYRRSIGSYLEAGAADPGATPQALGYALLAVAASESAHRAGQQVEVVWTGPDTANVPFRRTEQVILQLLDGARDRVTLVSYAVYEIPRVREALVRAAGRGVQLTVILETPDKVEGEHAYSTLRALGRDVAARARVYYWPREHRREQAGKIGKLHAKCLVADGSRIFISSANLTQHAFELNMELGVLITGGKIPGEVEKIFEGLIGAGVVVEG